MLKIPKSKEVLRQIVLLFFFSFCALSLSAQAPNDTDFTIRINQYAFDPLEAMPGMPAALRLDTERLEEDAPVLIQFRRLLTRQDMQLLKDQYGLRLDRYVSGCAYIEMLEQRQLNQLKELEIFRWTGPYEPAYKLSQDIGKLEFQTQERQSLSGILLVVILTPESDSIEMVEFLSNSGASRIRQVGMSPNYRFEFIWPSNQSLSQLAMRNDVFSIYEVPEVNSDNNSTAGTIQSGTPGTTPVWNNNIHGEGEIIHVLDSELDITHCFFADNPNTPGVNHRKVVGFRGSNTGSGHGTFVAGIAAGDDFNNPGNANNRGMAWAARLTFSPFGSSNFLNNLVAAQADGAFIHTNSWHLEPNIWYDQVSFDLDNFTWNNEDHLVLGSSGNNGERLGAPGTAKNAICVSASQSDPTEINFADGNSGPTPDNRRKPDLFSVGCNVNSARATTNCTVNTWPGNPCATSWATPSVAGAAALIRQYYRDGFYPSGAAMPSNGFIPSGALLKASLMNSTLDMTGIAGYPGNQEGWGLIRLDNVLFFDGDALNTRVWDIRHANGLATGESHTFQLVVSSSTQRLKITMAYSDAPGTAGSDVNVLTNDLDLSVTAPDGTTTFLGNVFANGTSTTGGADDDVNNVEMVLINTPQAGVYTIQISAEAVNVGNPGQGYALVATGDFPDPPVPSGAQNTLVVKLRENSGAAPAQPSVANKLSSVISYINKVSYGQTSLNPIYFPSSQPAIKLDNSYGHYFQPNRNPLIEMSEEVVGKMLALDPDVFTRGTADPNDDIDRIMLVTNQPISAQEWATTGPWPYSLPTGLPAPLSVSVNSVNHPPALFQHNMCNQLGLWNLHAHPGVVFSQPHVDQWDLMAKPLNETGGFATTGLMAWSKERVDWISDHGSDITYIPRPTGGSTVNQTLGLNHITDNSSNRKAIVVGLTEGAANLEDEEVFFWIEARTNEGVNIDETLPETGVLIYRVNQNIAQGEGPVRIIDTDLADPDPSFALINAALGIGAPPINNINGTGLNVSVAAGTSGNDYNVIISYDPPETDNDVRITVGNPVWSSPDIWVDNQADGYDNPATASDKGNQPITGEDNRIYVRINNPGPGDAFDFDVFVRVSEPYHTVGGNPDFNVFVEKRHFDVLAAGDTETFYVVWRPDDDGDPHSCIQVDIPNVFNDINSNNNRAQQNTQEIASTTASPYTAVDYHFGFTNPRSYQGLFYFRPEGIPADWTSSISQRSALLNPGERVDVTLRLQPPDDAPVCTDVRVDVSSWEAIGNTLVPVGGGTVQVDLRRQTNFNIEVVDTCTFSREQGRESIFLTHYDYNTQLLEGQNIRGYKRECGLISKGCTDPVRPFEEIIIKYESPDGYPIYKKVTTDANGCFSDYFETVEGGQWEVSAIYPGDDCAGPADAGPIRINVPGGELEDSDGDGLIDREEPQNGNGENPCLYNPDCDGDGIPDGRETPDCILNPDCDNNGKSDGQDQRESIFNKLQYAFRVGSAHPLSTLDRSTDANIHAQVGFHLAIGKDGSNQLDLLLGFHQFTREPDLASPHPYWFNANVGYTRLIPLANQTAAYLRAGVGGYRNKFNASTFGYHAGAGIELPFTSSNRIVFGLEYHALLQEFSDRFLNLHLGVKFGNLRD